MILGAQQNLAVMMNLLYSGQDLKEVLVDWLGSGRQNNDLVFRYSEVRAESIQYLMLAFDLLFLFDKI